LTFSTYSNLKLDRQCGQYYNLKVKIRGSPDGKTGTSAERGIRRKNRSDVVPTHAGYEGGPEERGGEKRPIIVTGD
jgi:hypothetical protein